MAGTHVENSVTPVRIKRSTVMFAVLVAAVGTAIGAALMLAPTDATVNETATPSIERLRELASVYAGEQFGYVPIEWDAPVTITEAERLRDLATFYDAEHSDSESDHGTPSPSLDDLREMAGIYDGQFFGPAPLND